MLTFQGTKLLPLQSSFVLRSLTTTTSSFVSLDLSYNNLADVSPDLLAASELKVMTSWSLEIVKLENICISGVLWTMLQLGLFQVSTFLLNWCKLTCEQLTKLLEVKNNSNKTLHLSLQGANFEGVPASLLVKFQLSGCINVFRRFISSDGPP